MTTSVDIANRALYRLGALPITTMDDATNQARMVKAFFEPALDRVFAERPWGFSLHYDERTDGEQKMAGWYEFTAPNLAPLKITGCRSVLQLGRLRGGPSGVENYSEEDDDELSWRTLGPTVISVKESASALIIWRSSSYDPTGFPSMFIDACVYSLAGKLAMPITKSRQTFLDVSAEYHDAVAVASAEDQSQGFDHKKFSTNALYDRLR